MPTVVVDHKAFASREEFEDAVQARLSEYGVQLVVLAGFMRVLTAKFVDRWTGRLLNIHPALLPLFKGTAVHEQVLEAGVCVTGCTVHFVDSGVDTGSIIAQASVPVVPGDTVDTLTERVKQAEHKLYPEALALVASGAVRLVGDKVVRS